MKTLADNRCLPVLLQQVFWQVQVFSPGVLSFLQAFFLRQQFFSQVLVCGVPCLPQALQAFSGVLRHRQALQAFSGVLRLRQALQAFSGVLRHRQALQVFSGVRHRQALQAFSGVLHHRQALQGFSGEAYPLRQELQVFCEGLPSLLREPQVFAEEVYSLRQALQDASQMPVFFPGEPVFWGQKVFSPEYRFPSVRDSVDQKA